MKGNIWERIRYCSNKFWKNSKDKTQMRGSGEKDWLSPAGKIVN